MQALANHTYAQIVGGSVQLIFTAAQLPQWADSSEQPGNPYTITAIDITGIAPAPQVGWYYTPGANGTIGIFSAPPAPPAQTPQPNAHAFMVAMLAAVGGPAGITAMATAAGAAAGTVNAQFTLLTSAILNADWATVQTVISGMNTAGTLTAAQYTAIKSAATTNNIPITLP